MGIPCLIIGESGSGKSASMRNFEPSEVSIFNIASKPLPFRKKMIKADNPKYSAILNCFANPAKKIYVIDDSQYLMSFEMFERAKETGFNKFVDLAKSFYDLVQCVIRTLPPDVIVYFLHHSEISDSGKVKAKTSGKMIDSQLTLEGMFAIVLMAKSEGGNYTFVTQGLGESTAKSPMGMFDDIEIDNDLKYVDTKIREYYEIGKGESKSC